MLCVWLLFNISSFMIVQTSLFTLKCCFSLACGFFKPSFNNILLPLSWYRVICYVEWNGWRWRRWMGFELLSYYWFLNVGFHLESVNLEVWIFCKLYESFNIGGLVMMSIRKLHLRPLDHTLWNIGIRWESNLCLHELQSYS